MHPFDGDAGDLDALLDRLEQFELVDLDGLEQLYTTSFVPCTMCGTPFERGFACEDCGYACAECAKPCPACRPVDLSEAVP